MHPTQLYNDVYSWKDYEGESQVVIAELSNLGISPGSILELACGTGKYLSFFEGWTRTGVDLCESSLQCAKVEMNDAHLVCADMTDTGLSETYDVILCLFGGISYVPEHDRIQAIRHWKSLLKPNGILVVEPWMEEEDIQFGMPFLYHFSCQEYDFSRVVVPQKEDRSCVLNFHFLYVDKKGKRYKFHQKDVLNLQEHHIWVELFAHNQFALVKEIRGFLQGSPIWFFRKHN